METEIIAGHIDVPQIEQSTRTELEQSEQRIGLLKAAADSLTVTSHDESKTANEMLAGIKHYIKNIDDTRKRLTAPLREGVKAINDAFNFNIGIAEEVDGIIKKKVLVYVKAQEAIKLEEARIKREAEIAERNRKQKELEEKAAATNSEFTLSRAIMAEENTKKLAEKEIEVDTAVRSESGTSFIRKTWKYEILKDVDVPRAFCSPDLGKIRAAVNAGQRDIAGVRIYEEESIGVR
jgi:SMC interacting uncharacterized protein involved in chromosome segregation